MNSKFENLTNFNTLYDAQNEEKDKRQDSLDEKEEQIENLISQLKRDKKELSKRLERSYLDSREDSVGLLMDLEVINKRLELNQNLRDKLFGNN